MAAYTLSQFPSAVCVMAARCKLPLSSTQECPKKILKRLKGKTKERKKEIETRPLVLFRGCRGRGRGETGLFLTNGTSPPTSIVERKSSPGAPTVRPRQSRPRPSPACGTQPALAHGPRAHRLPQRLPGLGRVGRSRWKVRGLLADERCSKAVLDFLSTTDVGRRIPAPAEEDAQSQASEWELRELREREAEREAELEELGAEVEEPLFPAHPSSWHRQKRSSEREPLSFCSFVRYFFGAISIFGGRPGRGSDLEVRRRSMGRLRAGVAEREGRRKKK